MRFSLILELEYDFLNIEYRRIILSYIKKALELYKDGKYFNDFYEGVKQKDFCFNVQLPKSRFCKDIIKLDRSIIEVLFSTPDISKTNEILINAFKELEDKKYPLPLGNSMTLKYVVEKGKNQEIENNKVIFVTANGGGVCIRNHNRDSNKDLYYVFNDDKFDENFNIVLTNKILNAGFKNEDLENIHIRPLEYKKIVVKHYNKYIDVSKGIFEMTGKKEILQYLYDTGIGSRSSEGFGMLELVNEA